MPQHPRFNEETGQWEKTWDRDPEVDHYGALMRIQWLLEPDCRPGYGDPAAWAAVERLRAPSAAMIADAVASGRGHQRQ